MRAIRGVSADYDFLIVEGIGGVRVPLSKRRSVSDMLRAFRWPVWVVARPGLGTINHTLLTLEHLSRCGVRVRAVVLSGYDPEDPTHRTNERVLRALAKVRVVTLPRFRLSARSLDRLSGPFWKRMKRMIGP